jgi:CheY-like chemotaxis protein
VLLDIGMPEMDGYEVARRIRATPAHSDVMLIALTGWGQEHDYRRSRAAGFNHHLVKPPNISKLHDLLTANWSESGQKHPSDRD